MEQTPLLSETQEYWRISSIYNGKLDQKLTVKQGLLGLRKVLKTVGPKRKLSTFAGLLMADFISPQKVTQKVNLPLPTPIRSTGV